MPHEVYIGTREMIEDKLNGVLVLGPFPLSGLAVGALTLAFNTPASTVTFSGSGGDVLSMVDIIGEINTQLSETVATLRSYTVGPLRTNVAGRVEAQVQLVLQRDAGFIIDAAGTSNALFNLSDSVDTTSDGVVADARVLGFSQGATPAHYAVIIAPPAP